MPRIRTEDVGRVRERSPIHEVVSDHVTLRPAGSGSLKGLCPFHDEKSPSFHVTPAKGLYFCFGCQAGGDVIDFVRRIDHLEFNEAVEKLAARAGVELRYEEAGSAPRRQAGERTRLLRLHAAAEAFYRDQLDSDAALIGRRFLEERGFVRSAAEQFGIGFAPPGWDALTRHLRAAGAAEPDLIVGGLAKQGPRGLIDRFRARLVWPIRDITGDTVGFGARRLSDDDPGPKYLNSPETPIYRKSHALYGIDLAKRAIATQRSVVIVEGYTDVMACHLAGVPTAVATCGTAFGDEHRRVLRRLLMDDDAFGGRVVFSFDGDEAGRKAALRAFEDDQRFVAQTYVAVDAHGLDPCELRQRHGEEALRQLLRSAVPMFEFAIKGAVDRHDLDVPEGRVAALHTAAPLVAAIRDRSLRPEYTRALAGWLGMEVSAVDTAVRAVTARRPRASRPAPAVDAAARATDRPDPLDRRLMVDRELVKVVLQYPDLAPAEVDHLAPEALAHPAYAAVLTAVRAAGGVSGAQSSFLSDVAAAAADDNVRALTTELAVESLRTDEQTIARYAREQLARVRGRQMDGDVLDLRSRLQRLPADSPDYASVFGQLVTLEQRRRSLREQAMGDA